MPFYQLLSEEIFLLEMNFHIFIRSNLEDFSLAVQPLELAELVSCDHLTNPIRSELVLFYKNADSLRLHLRFI